MQKVPKIGRIALIAILITLLSVSDIHVTITTANQVSQNLFQAEKALEKGFNSILEAEMSGANVTSLIIKLNQAATLIEQAELANKTSNNNIVIHYATRATKISYEVNTEAITAKEMALIFSRTALLNQIIISTIITVIFSYVLFMIWRRFKRKYINSLTCAKPEVRE